MKELVCENLYLTIWHDGYNVRVHLEDALAMADVTVTSEIGASTRESRAYHLKEAIIIGVRQVISRAFEEDMMRVEVKHLPLPPAERSRGIRFPNVHDDLDEMTD